MMASGYLLCKSCSSELIAIENLCFYNRHDDVLLTKKYEVDCDIESKIIRSEPENGVGRDGSRRCKIFCNACNASVGHELPFGPRSESIIAFGPEKISLLGIVLSKQSKWRNSSKDEHFRDISKRHRANFYGQTKRVKKSLHPAELGKEVFQPQVHSSKVGGAVTDKSGAREAIPRLDQKGCALKRVFDKFLLPANASMSLTSKDATNFLA